MITKFKCVENSDIVVEFRKEHDSLIIEMDDLISEREYSSFTAQLSKENLFSLIGQLLRIQAEIKEGGKQNG